MARFIRDEKKTFPFWWLTAGGLFVAATTWAVYAELVTRVPWEDQEQAFFDMELEQSKQALDHSKSEWDKQIEPSLKDRLDRRAELDQSMRSGAYAEAKRRLQELSEKFDAAELNKTFGSSDLDEAYYYRNLAEYERDAAAVAVRNAYHDAFAAEDPTKAQDLCDKIADPPEKPASPDVTDKMHHLNAEVERMEAHIQKITEALRSAPAGARKALDHSKEAEEKVLEKLKLEQKHQKRVDEAVAAMSAVDGPQEPSPSEKDPQKRAEERKRACQGKEDTRNCILWLKLEPVDVELKAIDVEVAKRRRPLTDAELRADKAETRAKPKFKIEDVIHSIVGPYQIQQVVMHWIDYDRDVDVEQVDRCMTCHAGADSSNYTSPTIQRQFRTHPMRSSLFPAHPIEKFGCTSCHQGQGRATDMLSHSSWHLETKNGKERWHFQGDHYWEEPLLPIGELRRIIVDDKNDELEVKLGKGKWEKLALAHRSPADHDKDAETPADYKDEVELFGALQDQITKIVEGNAAVKEKWHPVVRIVDHRVQIGLEQNNAADVFTAKEIPSFGLRFAKPELAAMLGFVGAAEIDNKQPIQVASASPSAPVRADSMPTWDKDGRYHPPRGDQGLQVPDDMRNRFIEALPEAEAGCLKCHVSDVDLKQRASKAKYNLAKLDYERAEAARKANPAAYQKAHDGADDLPAMPPDPSETVDPVPTYTEGRALFRKLNCTGCHILDGYPWDRNSGPGLDNITAKVSPEWLLTWVRYPRGWRAKTRMPNLWPKPLDPASKRPYPQGSPEYQQWEEQMREQTTAVASYLIERSDNPGTRAGIAKDAQPLKKAIQGYADVPDATAEKGKQVFESYGCQGCHARSDKDSADEKLPEPWRSRERDIAPTLANMAGKSTADWIAYWVEEPNRYWHGTKMPNLRLTREEAASVGKYVASLKEAPLQPADVDKADVALIKDAAKRAEKVPCSVAAGAVMSRVECGEKVVANYGCFGCHQISGFEKSAPIAPELGGFAKKDVTTLDFGYALADHHLHTTETFAAIKLDSPRIYRRDRIELKMGDFDLSPKEIRALLIFLKGLTTNKPKSEFDAAKQPEYAAALEGRQIIDDYNCRACHQVEEHGADIDGFRSAQLAGDPQARAPYLTGEGARVQPEWLFTFLREPGQHGIRPWLHPEWAYGHDVPADKMALRMPTFNLSSDQVTAIVRYFASWDGQEYPYQAAKGNELTDNQKLYALTHMISTEAANCLSCHFVGEFPVERGKSELAKMAPNFDMVARRLRPEWVKAWLLKPSNFLPYTKMTAFWATTDREKENPRWPSESDPFRSVVPAWNKVPGFPAVTTEQQVEMVRDFLFGLPADAVFPKPGEEASSPLVMKAPIEQPQAAKDEKDDKGKDKGKDKAKDKAKGKDTKGAKPPKRSGAVEGPVRRF